MRKDMLSDGEAAALVFRVMQEAPEWGRAVVGLLRGDDAAFSMLIDRRAPVPQSVRPVLARLSRGQSMRLDGRPPRHPFDLQVRVWGGVMSSRHLGMTAIEAERVMAAETGLTRGQVAGIVENFVSMGMGVDAWRAMFPEGAALALKLFPEGLTLPR